MVRIIGYGEDALTYHALTKRSVEVLKALGDASDPGECTLFYRPSFGRGGLSMANMGECDAIFVTPHYMYLIESKRSGSKELTNGELAKCQSLRHDMLNWVAGKWNAVQSADEFFARYNEQFAESFIGKKLAPPGSGVLKRMSRVFEAAQQASEDGRIRTKNVLLVFQEKDAIIKPKNAPENFILIQLVYEPMDESGFFDICGQ